MTEETGKPGADAPSSPEFIETVTLTEEQREAQKRRSRVIGLSIAGFVVLVFLVSLVRFNEYYETLREENLQAAEEAGAEAAGTAEEEAETP